MIKNTLAALALLCSGAAFAHGALDVDTPWIREAPPGMQMMAGYATLKNDGDHNMNIVDVESDAFGDIELHATKTVDGVAKMIQQEKLIIPAGGELKLSPGGYHLMLMMPKAEYKAGEKIDMTLKFQNGETQTITFDVKKGGDMSKMMKDHPAHN